MDGRYKRVLLVGGTGFLGKHFCHGVKSHDISLSVLARKNIDKKKFASNINFNVLESFDDLSDCFFFRNQDVLLYFAAKVHQVNNDQYLSKSYKRINSNIPVRLAQKAIEKGIKRFIYISSIKVNGEKNTVQSPYTENSEPDPVDNYGKSKWDAEKRLLELAKNTNLEVVIIRPPLVYGSEVKANFKKLIQLVCSGFPLPFGKVNNLRSFVYVENLVDAIITCIDHPKAKNQTFIVSDGEDISTPELIRKIAKYSNCRCYLLPIPTSILKLSGVLGNFGEKLLHRSLPINSATIDRLLGSLVVDSSKIRETLDWTPPFTLDEGLKKTLGS